MPWLAIPHGNKCKKLTRYFGLSGLPTLDMIDPDRKTLKNNVANIIDEHGVEAWEGFPLSAEKLEILADKVKAKGASQTLELLLVSGDQDFVMRKDGAKLRDVDMRCLVPPIIFFSNADVPCACILFV